MRRIAAIPRRLANAFVVLFGQHGEISGEAGQTSQTRQSMYRDTQSVVEQVDGSRAEVEIDLLRQQLAQERLRADVLAARLERAVEPRSVSTGLRQLRYEISVAR